MQICSRIATVRTRLIMLIPRIGGQESNCSDLAFGIKLGSRDTSRTESRRGRAYTLSQNRRLVSAGSAVQTANCFALSFPSPLRHTPTNVRLPVSTQRYGREAHPAFAVVVRETLPKHHRTKNSMTFHRIFASGFLEASVWSEFRASEQREKTRPSSKWVLVWTLTTQSRAKVLQPDPTRLCLHIEH